MADELDPPRKYYQLKPTEFEVLNEPASAAPPPGPAGEAQRPKKIDVHELYQQALTPGPVLRPGQKPSEKNEIHAILDGNLARADAAGLNDVSIKPRRRSRRIRDFLIVVLPLDAFFAYAAFGPYSNVMLMAYGVAGVIVSTVGIGWILFFVMDDY